MKDEIGGACSANGEMGNAYKIFIGKSDGNRPFGRPRSCWKNCEMVIRETGCGLNSSDSIYGPVAGACEHGNEPLGFINGGEFID
jgi:hypothetical protein